MIFTEKIQKALKLASILHFEQKRKGDGSPYISHPFAVAFIIAEHTKDEDIIAAAILHDVLEDVSRSVYSIETMQKDFGMRVYDIVKEVTEDKDPEESKEKQRQTWKSRKDQYLRNLQNDSQEALLVACADKIHNLMSLIEAYSEKGGSIWKHFNAPAQDRLWFYKEVLEILKQKFDHPLVAEFEKIYKKALTIIK